MDENCTVCATTAGPRSGRGLGCRLSRVSALQEGSRESPTADRGGGRVVVNVITTSVRVVCPGVRSTCGVWVERSYVCLSEEGSVRQECRIRPVRPFIDQSS